jgi:hypothetical protein
MYYIYVGGEQYEEFLSNSAFIKCCEFIDRKEVAPNFPYLFSLVVSAP